MKWNARRISINNNRNSIGAKGIVLPDPTIYRLSLAEQRTYLNSRFWRPECRNSTDSVDSAANQCRIVPPLLNGRPLWTVRVVEQRHGLQQLRTEKHGGLAVTHSECESICKIQITHKTFYRRRFNEISQWFHAIIFFQLKVCCPCRATESRSKSNVSCWRSFWWFFELNFSSVCRDERSCSYCCCVVEQTTSGSLSKGND